MAPTTRDHNLAEFGLRVLTLLAFTNDWNSDTFQAIEESCERTSLDLQDRQSIRRWCHEYSLDATDFGDTLPTIRNLNTGHAVEDKKLLDALDQWHNAAQIQDPELEAESSRELIDVLFRQAGLELK